ncbi:MAG: hypothetical protein ACREXJ_05160 [Gammaproteobacteria bacterium]
MADRRGPIHTLVVGERMQLVEDKAVEGDYRLRGRRLKIPYVVSHGRRYSVVDHFSRPALFATDAVLFVHHILRGLE